MPSTGFQGLRVVSFESRRHEQMAELITERGGRALVAPSMQEIPLDHNQEAVAFGKKLRAGEIDAVLFFTGVGAETLLDVLTRHDSSFSWAQALAAVKSFARGPKVLSVLKNLGIQATPVDEPATWREILRALDQWGPIQGKTIAVQEYGAANKELTDELARRGARVLRVPVYRWALPENREPLRQALRQVIDGEADVVLFTNSNQINLVLQLAQEEGIEKEFRTALAKTVVASVGPFCSQFLDEYGVPVDIEPEQPRMGELVREASERGPGLLEKKRREERGEASRTILFSSSVPSSAVSPSSSSLLSNSPFMKACRREATPYTPIWLMRQAGRYMKEYRDVRERHSFLELCKDSDLATEVTVYAVQRLGVDAAIIFSDILLILEPMGLSLEYAKGDGPVIHNPVRTPDDIERLTAVTDPAALGFAMDAIRKTRAALPPDIPLIGFAGAPFTLASYMIEGMGSRNYIHTKALMYNAPEAWHRLMRKISEGLVIYLRAQIEAGAQAVQLFDSWVGCLSPEDYRQFVLPHSRHVLRSMPAGVPVIHFGTQTGSFLELIKEAGGSVIGLDWRVELDAGWKSLGDVAIQGNLDPVALFAEIPEIKRQAKRILSQAAGRPGHIFNLGHGILPQTPVGHVKALVDAVHEMSAK
jgi:uroporphyrinogen decarboxylase